MPFFSKGPYERIEYSRAHPQQADTFVGHVAAVSPEYVLSRLRARQPGAAYGRVPAVRHLLPPGDGMHLLF
jgi:hypothetical protein